MPSVEDKEDVIKVIARRTSKILEAKRNQEIANKLAKMMKNYDLLRGTSSEDAAVHVQMEVGDELMLDALETERQRKLQDVEEFLSAGGSGVVVGSTESGRYEAPLIRRLRSVETVAELYRLADLIVPPIGKEL